LSSSSHRMLRVADQMQHALAELLSSKANDPRFHSVTITGVEVSLDMAHATVFVSLLDEKNQKEILAALNKAAGFFRFQLAHILNLRITPRLRFVFDSSISYGNHISQLINSSAKDPQE
jgi:ribosome-binding factor A